jgi:hypothetical protein
MVEVQPGTPGERQMGPITVEIVERQGGSQRGEGRLQFAPKPTLARAASPDNAHQNRANRT